MPVDLALQVVWHAQQEGTRRTLPRRLASLVLLADHKEQRDNTSATIVKLAGQQLPLVRTLAALVTQASMHPRLASRHVWTALQEDLAKRALCLVRTALPGALHLKSTVLIRVNRVQQGHLQLLFRDKTV